jgi:MFS family permease
MMTPVARLIVVGSVPREKLLTAMGWFTMPALVGPLIGPPLAGFVLSVADWPWIFYLNLPVGLLGMAAVTRYVHVPKEPDPGAFDWTGFWLSAAAVTGLVAAAETAGVGLLPLWAQIAFLLISGAAFTTYLRRPRSGAKPILDLSLLRFPTYRASLLGGGLVRLGIGAGPLLMPLLLQVGLGWTPLQAGSVTLAGGVGVFGSRPLAARALRRFGFRTALVGSVALVALLAATPGFFRAATPIWLIAALLLMTGFFRASQFISANTIAYADVPQDKVAAASTLAAVAQQVSLALGVSFGGLMLHLARGNGGALTPDRFILPFLSVGAITLLAIPVYAALDRDAGSEISGRPPGPTAQV